MSGADSTSSAAARGGPQSQSFWKRLFKRTKTFMTEATDANGVRKAAANLPSRKIYLNIDVPQDKLPSHAEHYCTNAITTSQYTYVNFLPKNLSRQFRRVANIYFLVLTVLQLIGYFALGSWILTILPILLVLAITAIKDAFEDWRRHISDNHFNETGTRIVRNLRNTNLLWQDNQADLARTKRMHHLRIQFARRLNKKTWYNQLPSEWEESQNPVDPAKPPVLNEEARWRNVRVGDFVILKTGDPAPADMLMLATSAEDGSCYVETKNLDGETNLKPRSALAETSGVRDAEGCARTRAVVEVDPPTSNMTKINGSIRIFSTPAVPTEYESTPPFDFDPHGTVSPSHSNAGPAPHHRHHPSGSISNGNSNGSGGENYELKLLGPKQTLPFKHSPLAQPNTKHSIASSSYPGDDGISSRDAPAFDPTATVVNRDPANDLGKSLPDNVNYESDPLVVPFSINNVLLRGMTVRNTDWIVCLVLYTGEQTKIVLNSGPTPYKRSRIERMMNTQVMMSFGFVFATSFIVALVGGLKYAEKEHRHSPYVDDTMDKGTYGFALFWSAMIMLQNVIPIALYVSIEFVKSWHAYWIYQDLNMYYEPTDQRCVARNWNISDDLGQVSYIFSDKTGTLTRNVMDFRMCSINGTIYGKQLPGDELDVVKGRMAQEEVDRNNPPEGGANPFFLELQDDDIDADVDGNGNGNGKAGSGYGSQFGVDEERQMGRSRQSTNTSIISHGTSQYDSSPLISTADSPAGQSRLQRREPRIKPVEVSATRSRARTIQPLSEAEAEAKRKQMIKAYVGAMRNVFDPKYAEIGDEETGEGGSYTFVDPQIFYDMRPETAPPNKVGAMLGNAPLSPLDGSDGPGADQGLAISPHIAQRVGSRPSISHGFEVDAIRQKMMVDLFMTELATCHSVVVEKSFQKHIVHDEDGDDRSTIRRFTRMFHSRSGSRKITDMVRHRRHRSKHHGRTDSVATATSAGEGIEWVASDPALSRMGHNASGSVGSASGFARPGEGSGLDDRFNAASAPGSRLRMGDGGHPYYSEHTSTSPSYEQSEIAPAVDFAPGSGPRDLTQRADGSVAGSNHGSFAADPNRSNSQGSQSASPDAEKRDMSKLAYSAESPDEGALVRAAKNFGYTFLGRVKNTIYLDIRGEKVQYEVLDTIEFNSTRKRMSNILRRPAPHSDIILFTKGADNVMIDRLSKLPSNNESPNPFESSEELSFERTMRERTFNQIDEFANAGLRTLMLGYRIISEGEWVRWSSRYHAAQASLDEDREEQIAKVTDEMERDLRIAGATAIEDKLQERVPETIASLRAAGIKIWVLTGDKMETAINIGFAANLLTKEMELWTINSSSGIDKVLSRFKLIARIMREMAVNDIAQSVESAAPQADQKSQPSKVGLRGEDARALGSVSYKIGRAKKFLHIGHSLRHRDKRGSGAQEPSSEGATEGDGVLPASTQEVRRTSPGEQGRATFPQLLDEGEPRGVSFQDDEDLSPNQVQASIDYLRRHSTLSDGGPSPDEAGHDSAAYHPLNALVIDGAALSVVLGDPESRAMLLEIAPLFKSVVCCRASPLQKAEVVKLVKDGLDLVTLAIGDGANDVSMIQTADIGVAISGEEGLQAAMASDYTVGRFHFLQNLLLVHGLFDYLRMSEMILSFFYKNVIWAMVPFWYSIYCAFSANVFYDLSYIQLYNVVFTVSPVIILGCVDKPFNYQTAMTYVAVYIDGIHNRYFKWWRYYMYVIDGIYQSVVIFFTFYLFTYKSDMNNENGKTWGRSDLCTGPTVAVVIAASLCVGFNAWQWNWMMAAAIAFSIVVCIAYLAIASLVRYYSVEGVATSVMSTIAFWFGTIISVVVALLPRYCVRCWQKMNRPRDLDIIREIKVLHRPWYGQVFVEPDTEVKFPPKDPKHHRPHMRKHKAKAEQGM